MNTDDGVPSCFVHMSRSAYDPEDNEEAGEMCAECLHDWCWDNETPCRVATDDCKKCQQSLSDLGIPITVRRVK